MSTHATHHTDKVRFGFWLYVMSDCVLFAGLFASYAVLRTATFGSPEVAEVIHLPYVVLETMLLLTSSFTMGLAMLAVHAKRIGAALGLLALTGALGAGFLGLEVAEFVGLIAEGASPQASASWSAFFALLGTHGLHVGVGLVWMLVVALQLWMRGIHESTIPKLVCLSMFWHFLDVVWIFIFTFVYLFALI